jgi:hypothetical protein
MQSNKTVRNWLSFGILLITQKKEMLFFGIIKKENTFAVPIIVRTYK